MSIPATPEELALHSARFVSDNMGYYTTELQSYRDMAERTGATLTEVLLVAILAYTNGVERSVGSLNRMVADLHHEKFPDRWEDCGNHDGQKP